MNRSDTLDYTVRFFRHGARLKKIQVNTPFSYKGAVVVVIMRFLLRRNEAEGDCWQVVSSRLGKNFKKRQSILLTILREKTKTLRESTKIQLYKTSTCV